MDFGIDFSELIKRAIKYLVEGLMVAIAAFAIPKRSLNLDEIAHVGDDLLDLPIMTKVGLAIAVNDANDVVKHYADWCTQRNGGQGAVREVCDLIMQSQGHLNAIIKSYTQ